MLTPHITPLHTSPPARTARRHIKVRRPVRRLPALVAGLGLTMAASAALTAPAAASTATGPEGQTLTVSKTDGLDPDGETITVEGSGYEINKGIYVVLCVDNGSGQMPTPCLGGVDMEGTGGTSAWISSNPPSYGEGLAKPFDEVGGKGSFSVQLHVAAQDEFTDCLDESVAPNGCVVGTRADHTRTADRSADVLIPVTFGTNGSGGANDDDSGAGEDGGAAGTGDDGGSAGTGAGVSGTGEETGTADDGTEGEVSKDDLAETGTPSALFPVAAVVAVALLGTGGALLATRRQTTR